MSRCFAKGRHRPCYGRMTVHHIVPQSKIKKEHRSLLQAFRRAQGPRPWSLVKALRDERNLLPACWGCHQCVESDPTKVNLFDLPPGFFEFVSEYGLAGVLPRHLMGVEAA